MNLDEYRSKRRFKQTPEPAAGARRGSKRQRAVPSGDAPLRFAIHKHDATKLHFDLRLEHAGVLLCWAVPRGPSLDPAQRRLAIQTEDHPLEYLDFEGLIPAGNYGAGPMILWDRGRWIPDSPPEKALADGKMKLTLAGERLRGRWALVRTGGASSRHWLLIKEKETTATHSGTGKSRQPLTASTEPVTGERTSIASGRTLAQVRSGTAASSKTSPRGGQRQPAPSPLPEIAPKLPTLVDRPPRGEGWLHELKLDGYRMQARLAGGQVKLITRGGHDWTDRLPELADAIASLPLESAVLDGELVALTPEGATDFSALQAALAQAQTARLVLFLFDLLYVDRESLIDQPLLQRKERLEPLIRAAKNPRLQYLDHVAGSPSALWQACRQRGLEGMVSKRADRTYRGGRAKDWLKTKHRRRERFVIGGVERSENALAGIGSLAVGYFNPHGRLTYCGKVGSGWSQGTGQSLLSRVDADRCETSPFDPQPGASLKASVSGMDWVRPRIVVEVEFAGVTAEGNLRHASLVAVHDRLPADSVVRDRVSDDVPQADLPVSERMQKPDAASQTAGHEAAAEASQAYDAQTAELLQQINVTNPQRILFPDCGVTKLDLIAYLLQVNQWLLPPIQDRLVSFVRCPDGITGEVFFQRHPGRTMPPVIQSVQLPEDSQPFLHIADLQGLITAAQMNVIEIHPWGSRIDRVDRPDRVVLDLDPDPAVLWPQVVDAAWIIRDSLRDRRLTSFVKTTGGKGLHVVIPIARRYSWERVGQWCQACVDKLVAANPKRFTGNLSKRARRGKIFIDHLRNRRGATSIAAYGVRARPGAPVSVPIFWEELTASLQPERLTIHSVPQRLRQLDADPWAGLSAMRQSLK